MEQKLQLLYPSVSPDIIQMVIEDNEAFILDYCNLAEIPESLSSVLLLMCQECINKLGAEGFSSEGAGGSSVSYVTDYSDRVYKRLNRHRLIKVH